MSEIYEKINNNTLKVTRNDNNIHVFEENRAEIQTRIDHWEFDKKELQKKIDAEIAKIAILDS